MHAKGGLWTITMTPTCVEVRRKHHRTINRIHLAEIVSLALAQRELFNS